MTKVELDKQISDVKALLGEPEFDFDRTPLNESAKRIKELKGMFKSEQMKAQWAAKNAFEQEFGAPERKLVELTPAKPLYIDDIDLKPFTAIERAVIEAHYENRDLNNQQLAKQFNIQRQTITTLFHSAQFKALKVKYYEFVMPGKLMLATEKLVDAGHEKTILRLNEHYGIIKAEKTELNITSKPLEDPEAQKLLRELGDKLAGKPSGGVILRYEDR